MNRFEIKVWRVHLALILVFAVIGTSLAILAVFLQDGETRGYATVGFLFLTAGLMALSVLTAIVVMAVGRIWAGLAILASGVILLTVYVLTGLIISGLK